MCTISVVDHYNLVYKSTINELPKPHVTIYLDAPIDVVKKRIAEKNDVSIQCNTRIFT